MARTVLITGCSDGGMGAALAVAFHARGDRVFATARSLDKMVSLQKLGIETFVMDVTSEESIAAVVDLVSSLAGRSLDVLINNAGIGYFRPLLDSSLSEVLNVFDVNTFSGLRVIQAFCPLLRRSNVPGGALAVNHTSINSVFGFPFFGPYNASKAAMASLTDAMRLELEPFNIRVIELKTGGVDTKMADNVAKQAGASPLPQDSLYDPLRKAIDKLLRGEIDIKMMPADQWAQAVVKDLSKKKPPVRIWRGTGASFARITPYLPRWFCDMQLKKISGLSEFEHELKALPKEP